MTDTPTGAERCPSCGASNASVCAYHENERPEGCINTDDVIEARIARLKPPTGAERFHFDERNLAIVAPAANNRITAAYNAGKEDERRRVELLHLKCVDCGGEMPATDYTDEHFPHFRNCPTLQAQQEVEE